MIRDVDSHNRREVLLIHMKYRMFINIKFAKKIYYQEISDCWRQNEMIKRSRNISTSRAKTQVIRVVNSSTSTRELSSSTQQTSVQEDREFWALQKVYFHF